MIRSLKKETLCAAGIEYSKHLVSFNDLLKESSKGHNLARYLLDFRHIITQESVETLDCETRILLAQKHEEMIIPEEKPFNSSIHLAEFVRRYNPKNCEKLLNLALKIQQKALRIESKDEHRWSEVLEQHVFKRHIQEARRHESPEQTAAGVLKRFRAERDHVWEFGREILQAYCQESHVELTAPKPDLCFSFHAIGHADGGPMWTDDYVQNFGRTKLNKLFEDYRKLKRADKMLDWRFGFLPSPLSQFYTTKEMKYQQCFPWFVCEWKHHGKQGTSDEKHVYCQAANAAAVCLTLLANAAATEYSSPRKHDVQPVVCMTFVGENSRVWIAYIASVNEETARYTYKMQCIWKGSLKNALDNVMLSVIIDRVHFWAMNHLKPWLSSCIDRWGRMVEEEWKRVNSKPEASVSDDELPNFPLQRADTLDGFIDNEEGSEDYDDDGSYRPGDSCDDSKSEGSLDNSESQRSVDESKSECSWAEDSEQDQQAENVRHAVRRTRSASNTPKKNTYQVASRSKKS